MQCDVISCVICVSNKVEYLEKEMCWRNSTKEMILCDFKRYLQSINK